MAIMWPKGSLKIVPAVYAVANMTALLPAFSSPQNGEETFFKVKANTKMSKVFNAYAKRKGVQGNALRFLLDGQRINAEQTPGDLELEDQDQIDCVLEQQGGC